MPEERRVVTVLFADVTGSTELGETLDPEDVRALLSRYYGIAKDVVASYGGTLEKFIGDAVMAVFGLPTAHGDDPQRALGAALELRDRVRADDRLGERIPLRIGVNSGEVVATRESTAGDFLVTGDAVNVAARLQQTADPWQIVVGERTVRAAGSSFAFGTLAPIAAKGKRAPVRAATLAGRGRASRLRVPMIGREDDLAQLELAAKRAFAERRPQLVSVVAPAGTGKTRLLEEFIDHLPALDPAASVAIAQCLPYGQRLTYWPLRAVLFRLASIPADADPPRVRETIRTWLAGSGLDNVDRVVELLAATVGAGEAEVTDRSALLAAWRSAIEHASRKGPLVVVFEDLHWSSDSLLDLVEFVMQPRGAAPVLVIALTRPELLDRRPTWGGGRRNYVAIALEPLSDDAVATLVGHLLEASSPEIVARVVARAEGNPFFAGELVRSLLDRVTSLQDSAAVERALATLPDTVQGTVLARLDLLGPDERRVLQLGAVLGRTFRPGAIAALAPSLTDALPRIVDVLLDKDLLRPGETDAFVFRHILIREVAYQTLPRAERARLHAAAARWYETYARGREDAYAELIAYHYREAASLAGAAEDLDANAIRRAAAAWLIRAADVAMGGAAFPEAARHLRAAVELAEPELLPAVYERLGDTHTSAGDAAEHYLTAVRLLREQGVDDPDRELRLLSNALEVLLRYQGSVARRPSDDALVALRSQARALLARATDARAVARFHIAESFYPFWLGRDDPPGAALLAEAEASASRGLAIAERLDDALLRSAALDGLGSSALMRGDIVEFREFARRRLPLRERLDLIELIDAVAMVAQGSLLLGELDEAIRVSTEVLTRVQPGQAPAFALHVAAWRMSALAARGRWDEALAGAERMLALWHEGEELPAGYATSGLESAYWVARARGSDPLRDRLGEAILTIGRTFAATRTSDSTLGWIEFAADLIERDEVREETLVRMSERMQALDRLVRALAVRTDRGLAIGPANFARLEANTAQVRSPFLRAQLDRARGFSKRDAALLGAALAAFERFGATPYAARARVERALITGDRAELETGLDALEAIGDREQLERYDAQRRGA